MEFSEALALMKKGKKIRQSDYPLYCYIFRGEDGEIYESFSSPVRNMSKESILSNDWELYE